MNFLAMLCLLVIIISFVKLVISILITKRNRKKWGKILVISCGALLLLSFFQPIEDDYSESANIEINNVGRYEFDLERFKDECEVFDYEYIARYPSDYIGSKVMYRGQVIQVMESGNNIELRMNVTHIGYGVYDDTIYVTYKKNSNEGRILENDIIDVYGVLDGLETYKSVIGNQVSIPRLNAIAIDILDY